VAVEPEVAVLLPSPGEGELLEL
jgi:hypothetical protein